MQKFRETAKCVSGSAAVSTYPAALIARRYALQQKLGSGSFGTVYLVADKKATQGEELKVLKEISVGEVNPNETVQASLEAQLLSKLEHPAIVKFYASFVDQGNFCIITEYCEGGDLDYKIQEYKEAGNIFPENQIMEWFIQLLLGVDYMHERRILHRDLKSKNIFLKNNRLKIGDFGVSRLLVGSCDLATTLTGTPHYMSPEALKHQGYDTKSDICMLNKNPSLRPSAIEILKIPYIDEQLQHLMCRYSEMVPVDKNLDRQKETARIINAVKTVEGKCEENTKRRQELRSQNFEQLSSDVPRDFNQPTSEGLPVSQLLPKTSPGHADRESGIEDTRADLGHHVIPEDPFVAEEYYADVFDSCSEESEEQEEEILFSGPEREVKDGYRTNQQDSDIEALIRCLENVLSCTSLDTRTITTSVAADTSPGTAVVSSALAGTKVKRLRELAVQKLGAEVFEEVYTYLKRARHQNTSEAEIQEHLEKVVPQASDCFEVDQLLYFEEQLLIATGRESAF
ncbi:serine/threonine-protein kinase Nek11 isoform X3 [Oryctolagus cuniculus]|uniref:serine/threonine-protein kinase Nek11 isoform X3 n=1 Tax=Oryctolagus cuniculus TaxID=9986 RepID=UPI00223028F1|nr:serine/threonine-protein kinase Nek11 isoform X3 [Oryctolagus cuniculus]